MVPLRRAALLLLATAVPAGCADPDAPRASGGLPSAEDLVRSDTALARLDAALDSVFALALKVAGGVADAEDALAGLSSDQREWALRRDACAGENDPRACVQGAYRRRTAELVAAWILQPASSVVFWVCEESPANEFVTTFFETEPPSARVERGDRTEAAVRVPSASGSRYEAASGSSFWISGDSALAEWPKGTTLSCRVREAR